MGSSVYGTYRGSTVEIKHQVDTRSVEDLNDLLSYAETENEFDQLALDADQMLNSNSN